MKVHCMLDLSDKKHITHKILYLTFSDSEKRV